MALNDELNENGLTTSTSSDIRAYLVEQYKRIYGDDIVLDSNTPDGQLIDIFTQMNIDLREKITELYNQQNPDNVRGTAQDKMYRINNLFRKGGTFTIQTLHMVIDATVTLQGLDANYNDITATAYGVTDNSGMAWYLIDTQTNLTKGEHDLLFRCSQMGDITPVLNTIINPIEIKQGVVSVTNNIAPLTIGTNQETDTDFAVRRERSTENKGQNTVDSMKSALLDIDGVSDAYVYSNTTAATDADGIPAHGIWVIVDGGANNDIATVIYANIAGSACKGDIEVANLTSSNQIFPIKFDRATAKDLYIKFQIQRVQEGFVFDYDAIKEYIVNNIEYKINEYADTSKPTYVAQSALASTGAGGVCVNLKISEDGTTWVDYIAPSNKKNKFVVSVADITITEAT